MTTLKARLNTLTRRVPKPPRRVKAFYTNDPNRPDDPAKLAEFRRTAGPDGIAVVIVYENAEADK